MQFTRADDVKCENMNYILPYSNNYDCLKNIIWQYNLFVLTLDYAGAIARGSARYGQGSGPILFTSVACVGDEYRLFECGNTVLTTSCSHSEDAGVSCEFGKLFHDSLITLST